MFEQISAMFMQYGSLGLFFMAFLDSFVLPVPPFFLQIAMSLLDPPSALRYATIAFLGSIAGAPMGYLLGFWLGKPLMHLVLPQKWIDAATQQFEKNGDAALLIGSFTPIPFKVFTILSGVFHFPLAKLMVYALIGRGLKFYLIGVLFHFFGKHAKVLLDQYLEVTLLAIGAVLAVVWFVLKRKKSAS